MEEIFNIQKETVELIEKSEKKLEQQFQKIEEMCKKNSEKVLGSFIKNHVSESHFNGTTGYGYNDIGRDTIEQVFSNILGAEDSLVRNQFISGTHALTVALFAFLRPNDTLLSISGLPYDTLHQVIGIKENNSSLKSFGVHYEQIDLINNDFDIPKIVERLKKSPIKLIEIQRSKGYSTRKSISIEKIEQVISEIRKVDQDVIIMVDNCYCEFVEDKTPLMVGADIIVGSLIKNLGGGIAPNGAYIAGKKELVYLASERLNMPGEAKEVGPSLGANKSILQGLFLAPHVVASALKTAILSSYVLENLGYKVEPNYLEDRVDIVQNIEFGNKEDLISFVQGIQAASPIDSFALPIPDSMPGYEEKVIMAAGSFTQGSSIELSCDGPLREPYIAYLQGGLTYEYGRLGVMKAIDNLIKK